MHLRKFLPLLLLIWGSGHTLGAQAPILWLQVSDPDGKPIVGVQISTLGPGAVSRPTDVAGKTRLPLTAGIKPGEWVSLQIVSQQRKFVFISPWNARMRIPSIVEGVENVELIVLGMPGNRELLANPQAIITITENILDRLAPKSPRPEAISAEERFRSALQEVAKGFNLSPSEVDKAIREKLATGNDPYQKGLAHLYGKNYLDASRQFAQSLGIRKKRLSEDRAGAADAARFLGQSLYEEGRYREATDAFSEALYLGDNDIGLLLQLTVSLHASEQYEKAQKVAETALDFAMNTLGPHDRALLASRANLGVVLEARGDWNLAQKIYEDVLAVQEVVLGGVHSDTLTVKHNLAHVLFAQGELVKARKLQEEVLSARTRLLGVNHPETLSSKANLAETLEMQGDVVTARQMEEEALAAMRNQLEESHPMVLRIKNNLAGKLFSQGNLVGAGQLWKEVIASASQQRSLVSIAKNNLALIFIIQKDFAGARKLQEEVLLNFEEVLGREHPFTLNTKANLARTLMSQGDFSGARKLQEEVLSTRERLKGKYDIESLVSRSNLAAILIEQKDFQGSRALSEDALSGLERVAGARHPQTTLTAINLLIALMNLGDVPAARKVMARVEWMITAREDSLSSEERAMRKLLLSLLPQMENARQ